MKASKLTHSQAAICIYNKNEAESTVRTACAAPILHFGISEEVGMRCTGAVGPCHILIDAAYCLPIVKQDSDDLCARAARRLLYNSAHACTQCSYPAMSIEDMLQPETGNRYVLYPQTDVLAYCKHAGLKILYQKRGTAGQLCTFRLRFLASLSK